MTEKSELLTALHEWFARQTNSTPIGVSLELVDSPIDWSKRSSAFTAQSLARIGRFVVWDTGEAEVELAEVESGAVRQQHHEIGSAMQLDAVVGKVLSWVLDESSG